MGINCAEESAERAAELICCEKGAVMLPPLLAPEDGGGALYFFLLVYTFFGVAIVSDVFMGAIEEITSQEKTILVESGELSDDNKNQKRKIKVKIWNDTVANLSLMALGSSAPEILLSVIELFGANYFAGNLGPSTIVGSAAFNLFMISAVCVFAIPEGEIRMIEGTKVYALTATISVFAYFWMMVILVWSSKDRVEIWEGVLTFLFFPGLVAAAWAVDTGKCFQLNREASGHIVYAEEMGLTRAVTMDMLAKKRKEVKEEFRKTLPEETLMKLVINQVERDQHKSRAHYRIAATRGLAGGKKVGHGAQDENLRKVARVSLCPEDEKYDGPVVEFDCNKYACLECCGQVTLRIVRSEETKDVPCSLHWRTVESPDPNRAATSNADYVAVDEEITFEVGELEKEVKVTILDDDNAEDDEDFFVELYSVQCEKRLQLGANFRSMVTIIDDDQPGLLQFTQDDYTVSEVEKEAVLRVERKSGCTGVIICSYRTEGMDAKGGEDYVETEGTLIFKNEETSRDLKIPLINNESYSKKCSFKVFLEKHEVTSADQEKHPNIQEANFTEYTEGGTDFCVCQIDLVSDEATKGRLDTMRKALDVQRESNKVGFGSYADQFEAALYPGGSKEEWAESSGFDIASHFLTLPWKIVFAFCPPTEYANGWVCFYSSLGMIGLVTAFVGDLASLLGCALDIPDEISAITLVALGTSLPDTFASYHAAVQDPYADASIGNITGSNSVNVFLGLGLPWTIGALYWEGYWPGANFEENRERWLMRVGNLRGDTFYELGFGEQYPNGAFMVPAGTLGYSVAWFSALAFVTVGILALRRKLFGGELGGPMIPRYLTCVALTGIWATYIAVSCLKAMDEKNK